MMNSMNIFIRHWKKIFIAIIYVLSFYCFSTTNTFRFFETLLSSFILATVGLNLFFLLLSVIVIALKKSISRFAAIVALILLFPSVSSLSKMNWLEKFFGLRTESAAPIGIVAITSFLLIVELVMGSLSNKLEERAKELGLRGADEVQLKEVYSEHRSIFLNSAALILLIALFVIIVGFLLLPSIKIGVEPPLLLLTGSIIAAAGLIYFMVAAYRKKKV